MKLGGTLHGLVAQPGLLPSNAVYSSIKPVSATASRVIFNRSLDGSSVVLHVLRMRVTGGTIRRRERTTHIGISDAVSGRLDWLSVFKVRRRRC